MNPKAKRFFAPEFIFYRMCAWPASLEQSVGSGCADEPRDQCDGG
ncbi:MAG: hypothetical protein ACPIB5_06920 [Flavobacteriaceae bacterium]